MGQYVRGESEQQVRTILTTFLTSLCDALDAAGITTLKTSDLRAHMEREATK
jgi:hypothetical protein